MERQTQMAGTVREALAQEDRTKRNGTLQDANTVLERLYQKFPPRSNSATEHPCRGTEFHKSWTYNRTLAAEWLTAVSDERGCHEIELPVIFALVLADNLRPFVAFTSLADRHSFGNVARCLDLP
jgi:hypothetical protein